MEGGRDRLRGSGLRIGWLAYQSLLTAKLLAVSRNELTPGRAVHPTSENPNMSKHHKIQKIKNVISMAPGGNMHPPISALSTELGHRMYFSLGHAVQDSVFCPQSICRSHSHPRPALLTQSSSLLFQETNGMKVQGWDFLLGVFDKA